MKRILLVPKAGIELADIQRHLAGFHVTIYQEGDAVKGADFDYIVTVGGDGTVLLAAWLFQGPMPPVLALHAGALGFLTTRHPLDTIAAILSQPVQIAPRARLRCTITDTEMEKTLVHHVLNEVVVDRGASSMLLHLDLSWRDDGPVSPWHHATTVLADGLIIATPTGSTAYSLSAGGPLVHPGLAAMVVCPICPHSLSWRPLVLPATTMSIRISIGKSARDPQPMIFLDGRERIPMAMGGKVEVQMSPYPVPTICAAGQSCDWFASLNSCLRWSTHFI